jgi:hypothetical protein
MNFTEELLIEFMLEMNPSMILNRCADKRPPEVERIIATRPKEALWYAENVIKGRWPEAEEAIASNHETALAYARIVLKGRFPEYEKRIVKDPNVSFQYCRAIGRRFPEAEPRIAKSTARLAINYAALVIGGRFELAEAKIAKKPKWVLEYHEKALKGNVLPDELHNAMTLHSFENPEDKSVKRYFQTRKP